MGGRRRRRWRLQLMLALALVVFLLELTVSRMSSSLTMLSHSFHTLSAVLALATDLLSLKLASSNPARNTYGWLRVGLLGALVEGIFSLGLCFSVLLKAAERTLQPRPLRQPEVLVGAGVSVLLHNLMSLYLLKGQPGHSSTQGWHPGTAACGRENQELLNERTAGSSPRGNDEVWRQEDLEEPAAACEESHLTVQGVFRHALGGTLGSVIVLVNGLTFYAVWPPCPEGRACRAPCVEEQCGGMGASPELAGPCWPLYLDPALCLVEVFVALWAARPLLSEPALVLLQAVPRGFDAGRLRARLLRLEGVAAVHELHVWRLAGCRLVATAHVKLREAGCCAGAVRRVGALFRQAGIRCAAVQPELGGCGARVSLCELACGARCASKQCCSGAGTHGAASKRRPKTTLNDATQQTAVSLSGYIATEYETTV